MNRDCLMCSAPAVGEGELCRAHGGSESQYCACHCHRVSFKTTTVIIRGTPYCDPCAEYRVAEIMDEEVSR